MAQKVNKKLYRSDNKILGGVCAGFAEYIDADPSLVRLIYVGISLISGIFAGILVYILAWIIIPEAPTKGGTKYMGKAKETK